MKISVGLIIFAVNIPNPINSYVLLKKEENSIRIPSSALPEDESSISIVKRILYEYTYITGNWLETSLVEQIGVWDDVDRNPVEREVFIAYSLFLPDKISIKPGMAEWITLDSLSKANLYLDHEDIIRFGNVKVKHAGI